MSQTLSATIITFNEERNIERCLHSIIDLVDEIIVVDSFSTDRTKEICLNFGVKFFQKEWSGYGEQKNYANSKANHQYVISLDADEALSAELKLSITKAKKEGLTGVYSFNRLTNYCGKWVKHTSWYPDTKVRIFPKDKALWKGNIHEDLHFLLPIHHLKGDLLHYSFYTRKEHINQIHKYSSIGARQLFEKNRKAYPLNLIVKPIARFLKNYIIKLGFLDGEVGLTISRLSAYANYLKYYKLLKLQRGQEID